MTDNEIKTAKTPAKKETVEASNGKSTMAWISLLLAIAAWALLFWSNGYVALGAALVAAVVGFIGIPHRTAGTKRLAITAIIAAIVLIVVVSSFLVVIKIGLA